VRSQKASSTSWASRSDESTLERRPGPLGSAAGARPHLITPNEAISRIRSLLAKEDAEVQQRLVAIAVVAIAAVIALDEDVAEMEEIDGLQESVNRALFI
jgi:hypothetical protein